MAAKRRPAAQRESNRSPSVPRSSSKSPILEAVDLNSPRGLDTLAVNKESSRISPVMSAASRAAPAVVPEPKVCRPPPAEDTEDMFAQWDDNNSFNEGEEEGFPDFNDGDFAGDNIGKYRCSHC